MRLPCTVYYGQVISQGRDPVSVEDHGTRLRRGSVGSNLAAPTDMNRFGLRPVPRLVGRVSGKLTMFSKINHVAIVSENYAKSALFYQAVFGMRTSDKTQTSRAQAVGDGYVGLNINPRRDGRSARLR